MSGGKDLQYCLNSLTESWTEFEIEKAEINTIISKVTLSKKDATVTKSK